MYVNLHTEVWPFWSHRQKWVIQPFLFSPCLSQQLHLLFSWQLCILPVKSENRVSELIRGRRRSYVDFFKHCQSNADHLGTKHRCGWCDVSEEGTALNNTVNDGWVPFCCFSFRVSHWHGSLGHLCFWDYEWIPLQQSKILKLWVSFNHAVVVHAITT